MTEVFHRETRPVILDLYSGAGGCAAGYYRAGFDVIGVDSMPQPRYPFRFIRADAIATLERYGHLFDAIHASPPCQAYSNLRHMHGAKKYPMWIEPTRDALIALGKPYIIENVETAPLRKPITLCGAMFGLGVYRHRLFESNVPLIAPKHIEHTVPVADFGYVEEGKRVTVAGKLGNLAYVSRCMGINWMTRTEIAEAIPPAYTEYLGRQLLAYLGA